jgi:hypothetical protein
MGRFCDEMCYDAWKSQQPQPLSLAWLYSNVLCELTTGCWVWVGIRGSWPADRYGSAKVLGEQVLLHRLSYELHVGPIAADLHVLHTCDVKACVRPDHLYLGTQAANMRDVWRRHRR